MMLNYWKSTEFLMHSNLHKNKSTSEGSKLIRLSIPVTDRKYSENPNRTAPKN